MPRIFYSYCQKDENYLTKIETHLSLLKREGLIETWYDRKLEPGTDWEVEIDQRINTYEIILLLVSPDFMASDYCYEREMKIAMQRHSQGDAVVIPIIIRPCDWESAPFGRLSASPRQGKAVSLWQDSDEAMLNIASTVRMAIERLAHREIGSVDTNDGETLPSDQKLGIGLSGKLPGLEAQVEQLSTFALLFCLLSKTQSNGFDRATFDWMESIASRCEQVFNPSASIFSEGGFETSVITSIALNACLKGHPNRSCENLLQALERFFIDRIGRSGVMGPIVGQNRDGTTQIGATFRHTVLGAAAGLVFFPTSPLLRKIEDGILSYCLDEDIGSAVLNDSNPLMIISALDVLTQDAKHFPRLHSKYTQQRPKILQDVELIWDHHDLRVRRDYKKYIKLSYGNFWWMLDYSVISSLVFYLMLSDGKIDDFYRRNHGVHIANLLRDKSTGGLAFSSASENLHANADFGLTASAFYCIMRSLNLVEAGEMALFDRWNSEKHLHYIQNLFSNLEAMMLTYYQIDGNFEFTTSSTAIPVVIALRAADSETISAIIGDACAKIAKQQAGGLDFYNLAEMIPGADALLVRNAAGTFINKQRSGTVDSTIHWYDQNAGAYDDRNNYVDEGAIQQFIAAMGVPKGELLRICDVGCGAGHYTLRLVEALSELGQPAEVTAFDASSGMIERAKRRAEESPIPKKSSNLIKLKFELGTIEKFFEPKREFDGVFAMCPFAHIPKSQFARLLRSVNKSCREGAVLFLNVLVNHPETEIDRFWENYQSDRESDTLLEVDEIVRSAGFRNISKSYFLDRLSTGDPPIKCQWYCVIASKEN